MNSTTSRIRRAPVRGIAAACLIAISGSTLTFAQQSDDSDFVPLRTSVNALMVALVDHAAHEIWEAGSAVSLTGRDWQSVEQHATQLIAAGTLVSIGGTGREDRNWAMTDAWQGWARALSEGGLAALAAVQDTDQSALQAAGELIIDACFGCHDMFKPDAPTEGLMHVPHYQE
jgi:hypothetical protein